MRRNSGLELLRIIVVIFIFWMHSCGSYQNNEFSAYLTIAINTVGNIGVSCFILISGYFGIRFSARKLLRLEFMLLFYSWLTLLTKLLWTGFEGIGGGEELLRYVLPVIGRRYWYFTCYFALVLLSPFINAFMENTGKTMLRKCILTMLFVFSVITTFFFFDITLDGGKGIVNMVMLYMIGRYIRMYQKETVSRKRTLLLFLIIIFVNFGLNCGLYLVTGTIQNRFARDNSLFTICQAVCIFMIFKNWDFENRIVNRIAAHVPAVFVMEGLLHSIVSRYFFDYTVYSSEYFYEFLLLLVVILLFLMGCVIERLRIGLFYKCENYVIDHVCRLKEKMHWTEKLWD